MKTKKKRSLNIYLTGGEDEVFKSSTPSIGNPEMMAINSAVSGLTGLVDVLSSGDPRKLDDREPLVNMATTRNMIDPYATGGEEDDNGLLDDLTDGELEGLQQVAEEQGLTVEELLIQLQGNIAGDEVGQEDEEFKSGGWIAQAAASIKRRGTKGKCTPITKPGCTGRARALAKTFKKIARNRKKHACGGVVKKKYALGGYSDDPGSKVAKTSADVMAANMEAKRFAKSRGLKYADAMYAVKGVGEALPLYVDANNRPLTVPMARPLPLTVPNDIGLQDIISNNGQSFYTDQTTGNLVEVDPSVVNISRFRKKMAMGGRAMSPINVENDEVLEMPNGEVMQARGARHEHGGIDVNVPSGTKIYSDRLKVGGKSMQERKLAREAKLNKLLKLTDKNPVDQTLKNTLKRTVANLQGEENRDMAIQKVAKKIYQSTKYAVGGEEGDPEGYFDEAGIFHPSDMMSVYGNYTPKRTPGALLDYQSPDLSGIVDPNIGQGLQPIGIPQRTGTVITKQGTGIGVGDAIGLAGNAFNAIAPIINTQLNRRATKPSINRFRGFGNKALDTNTTAQNYVAGIRTNAISDIDTSANSAYARNRNSALGVNTQRALDIATNMSKNKAVNQADSEFSRQMMGLLSERSRLENEKDLREMTGETARDLEEKADTDNYYSNMAANLVNFGTNVQGIGKNLNQVRENKTNKKLLSQLSRYGLTFDDEGNLING